VSRMLDSSAVRDGLMYTALFEASKFDILLFEI
jgi:hypothetical protein